MGALGRGAAGRGAAGRGAAARRGRPVRGSGHRRRGVDRLHDRRLARRVVIDELGVRPATRWANPGPARGSLVGGRRTRLPVLCPIEGATAVAASNDHRHVTNLHSQIASAPASRARSRRRANSAPVGVAVARLLPDNGPAPSVRRQVRAEKPAGTKAGRRGAGCGARVRPTRRLRAALRPIRFAVRTAAGPRGRSRQ